VLDEFEGEEVIAALLDALEDQDEQVRLAAAETLSENKDESAGPAILERVNAEEAFVKASCLRALRELRLPESHAVALACLEDEAPEVRREAVGVLAYLKDDNVLLALMNAARSDSDPMVRKVAVGSLIFTKSARATEALIAALKDENWQVREEAAFIMGKVGLPEGVEPLIDAMNDEYWQVRVKAAGSLGSLKDPAAVAVLGQALSFKISNLRKEAATALGQIAAPEGLPFLEAASKDVDPDVRKIAQWAIEQIRKNS
jgi:HEAT repeat protein